MSTRAFKKLEPLDGEHSSEAACVLSPKQAKERILSHWDQLDRQAKRRFPRDENLAHAALLFVIDHLERNEWKRVRRWQATGPFLPFLITLTSRLLTDFQRFKSGHIRKPAWIAAKSDPLWDAAYTFLIVERNSKQEAISRLKLFAPDREDWYLNKIASEVHAKCSRAESLSQVRVPVESAGDTPMESQEPEDQLSVNRKELGDALARCLGGNAEYPPDGRTAELLSRFQARVKLDEEDRLILRMRFEDGLSVPAIAKMLHLSGDPYKRLSKLLAYLREVLSEAEFE